LKHAQAFIDRVEQAWGRPVVLYVGTASPAWSIWTLSAR